jgi:hypothetical protein
LIESTKKWLRKSTEWKKIFRATGARKSSPPGLGLAASAIFHISLSGAGQEGHCSTWPVGAVRPRAAVVPDPTEMDQVGTAVFRAMAWLIAPAVVLLWPNASAANAEPVSICVGLGTSICAHLLCASTNGHCCCLCWHDIRLRKQRSMPTMQAALPRINTPSASTMFTDCISTARISGALKDKGAVFVRPDLPRFGRNSALPAAYVVAFRV